MRLIPPSVNRNQVTTLATIVERMLETKFSHATRPVDVYTVAVVDTTNHWCQLQRPGDQAAHTGYRFRYLSTYAPTVGDEVVVHWVPTGPYVAGTLA